MATEKGAGAGDLECPKSIVGLERSDYSERILRSCRDSLDPSCSGIEVKQIEADDEKSVVMIKVPQSLEAPHMVTFDGEYRFWQRHGTDKQRMSTQEIRDMIMSRLNYHDQVIQFAQQRIHSLRERTGIPQLLYIWAAPVVPLLPQVDVKDKELRNLLGENLLNAPYSCSLYSGQPRPSLDGIEAEEGGEGSLNFIRLWRSGFLEFGTQRPIRERGSDIIQSFFVAAYMDNFASLVTQIHGRLGAQGPVALGCCFVNVGGHRLYKGRPDFDEFSPASWADAILDLGHELTYDFAAEKPVILRRLNDVLWNAFHFEECPYYETGKLVPPRQ